MLFTYLILSTQEVSFSTCLQHNKLYMPRWLLHYVRGLYPAGRQPLLSRRFHCVFKVFTLLIRRCSCVCYLSCLLVKHTGLCESGFSRSVLRWIRIEFESIQKMLLRRNISLLTFDFSAPSSRSRCCCRPLRVKQNLTLVQFYCSGICLCISSR